ncbi:MAG: hypothetical protein P0S93_05470 [Candidatus Neptunochlamydia sp.]|nr:hypothetical protein [Candidatus Neptunochlamydia sp.]
MNGDVYVLGFYRFFRKLEFKKYRRLYFSFGLIAYFILTTTSYLVPVASVAALLFGIRGAALSKR